MSSGISSIRDAAQIPRRHSDMTFSQNASSQDHSGLNGDVGSSNLTPSRRNIVNMDIANCDVNCASYDEGKQIQEKRLNSLTDIRNACELSRNISSESAEDDSNLSFHDCDNGQPAGSDVAESQDVTYSHANSSQINSTRHDVTGSIKYSLVTCLIPFLIPFGIIYGLFSMLTSLPRASSSTNYNNNRVYNTARSFRPFGRATPSMPSLLLPILLPFMLIFHIMRGILAPLEFLDKMQRRR